MAKMFVFLTCFQILPKKESFAVLQSSFCLSKPQAWHIIAAQRAAYIIKGGDPPLYLITRQRASSLGTKTRRVFEAAAMPFGQGECNQHVIRMKNKKALLLQCKVKG